MICLLLIYVPFLGNRVVRPAGDDKVYVSQAVEMARSGHWFLQTLANVPAPVAAPAPPPPASKLDRKSAV